MSEPAFDPNGAVRFDLKSGTASDGRGARLVLVPASALAAVEQQAPGALAALASAVGEGCGERVAARLGGEEGVRAATLELVVAHLAGELAIAGLGAIQLERWGRAMVLVVDGPAVESDAFVSSVLSGALAAATGRNVAIAALGSDGSRARYFVGAERTVDRVRAQVTEGAPWADVLRALQEGAA